MLIAEMQRRGVENPNNLLATRNYSLVLVRGFLRPGIQKGDHFDVELRVKDRSETTSLRGGYLLETRLSGHGGDLRQSAGRQGPRHRPGAGAGRSFGHRETRQRAVGPRRRAGRRRRPRVALGRPVPQERRSDEHDRRSNSAMRP